MDLQNMKKILKKIFFLSPVPTLLISIPAYSLVIYALAGERVDPVIKYLSYFLSAYALVITVTGTVGVVRFVREGMKKHPLIRKILGIPVVNRYLGEDLFRAETALYQGFFSSLLYAGIKMCSGIFYRSVWFVTLAVYYILPALMRASLLHYVATVWALVLGRDRNYIYGRLYICGDGAASAYCLVYHPRNSGVFRVDTALFSLQKDSGQRDRKDCAVD